MSCLLMNAYHHRQLQKYRLFLETAPNKKLKDNSNPYISTQKLYTDIAPIIGNNSEQTPLCHPLKNTGDQRGEFIFISS
jgi:hypothetical protein